MEMSIKVTAERGEQLREFARLKSLGIGESIGCLLDHAVTTGLVRELALPDIGIEATDDSVCLQVGGIKVGLSALGAKSLADNLQKVASKPGAAVLDMDNPHYIIELCRQGRAVVLRIAKNDEKVGLFARTFACDVARALASRIAAAAKQAAQATAPKSEGEHLVDQDAVEALMADLEITEEEVAAVTERDNALLDASMESAIERA
jgi:hypothetical protein